MFAERGIQRQWLSDMLNTVRHKQRGISLVELMVGMAIGLLITAAAASAYIASSRGGADTLRSAKLNMELRGAMDVMVAEIRRAGHAPLNAGVPNPFNAAGRNLTISGPDCILFSYDANGSGSVDSADYFGFKRNGNALAMRQGGTSPSTSAGCSVATDSWENLTDPNNVVIDSLVFTVSYQCQNARTNASASQPCAAGNSLYDAAVAAGIPSDLIEVRSVLIDLAGRHANDAAMRMQLSQTVRVRNDRVQTVP